MPTDPAEPPGAALPVWRTVLGTGIRNRDRAGEDARGTVPRGGMPARTPVPLALQFELREPARRSEGRWRHSTTVTVPATAGRTENLRIAVRPVIRSASGRWSASGIDWGTLQHQINRLNLHERQVRFFSQFAALNRATQGTYVGQDRQRLILDDFASPLLWQLLGEAERLGIALVGPKGAGTIVVAERARVSLEAASASDAGHAHAREGDEAGAPSGLRLRTIVTFDEREVAADTVGRIGDHGLYTLDSAAGPRLVLAPTAEPLTSEQLRLLSHPELDIAAADVDEFLRDYYPALARRVPVTSTDASVRLPAIAPPHAGAAGPARDDDVELTEPPTLTVTTVASEQRDWFDLGIIVHVGDRTIPFGPLFTALATGRRRLKLIDNSYLSLNRPVFDRLKELIDESRGLNEWETGPRISRYQASLWQDLEELADHTEQARSWRQAVGGLLSITAEKSDDGRPNTGVDEAGAENVPEMGMPDGLTAELRGYQREGFRWLAFLWQHGLGGILADDMGLGKTVQTLALIAHARAAAGAGTQSGRRPGAATPSAPFLVVAPTSVVSNWVAEAARFTPGLRVATITTTQKKAAVALAESARGADVVVTSYTLFRLDAEHYRAQAWAGLVLDEAQFVKNHTSSAHRCARELNAPWKLAITGTPMENNLTELWALFAIVAPGLFPSLQRFTQQYVRPLQHERSRGDAARVLARLRRRIRPLMLRRTKELVAPELPARQEQVLHVELAPKHRVLYDTVLQRERQKLLGLIDDLDANRFIVFRSLTLLRMLSLDASLIDDAYAGVPSSKLDALFEQLEDVLAEGHRALVFSQFTTFLRRVATRLAERGIDYAYLDGSTRRRGEVIERFRSGEAGVFLISLKAGGFGLNLTEADYVFLLDPWWNPASEAQAVDRTHRIGQSRQVMVYRLVATGTIEEKVMALKAQKSRLFDAVLDDDANVGAALTADDIRGLLEE